MSKKRQYYSVRKGLDPRLTELELPLLRDLFLVVYEEFYGTGYFQEALGYYGQVGPDEWAHVRGRVGDEESYFFRTLRKRELWPIRQQIDHYSEDDLFDVVELLYDLVAKPMGEQHAWGEYDCFEQEPGQKDFRHAVNGLLQDYQRGYELSPDGETIESADAGLQTLFEAELPELDAHNLEHRVEAAIRKFRRRSSSLEDRRDAVKSLADVLEFLRPELKRVITRKDDSTLFHIANEFGIRHHNIRQKTDYDQAVWLSWMFYFFLATIHAGTRLVKKASESERG